MLDRISMDFIDAQSSELKQYCKMEHVMLFSLVRASQSKNSVKRRIQAVVCRMLQRMNNWLTLVINRLTADMEHSGGVRRRLS